MHLLTEFSCRTMDYFMNPGSPNPCIVPPQQARSQKTLARIVVAAHRMILREGYDDLSMSELAREAKIGLSSLYSRFPSKERLLIFVAEEMVIGRLREEGHPATKPSIIRATSLEGFLRTYCKAIAYIFSHHRPVLKPMTLLFRSSQDTDLTRYLKQTNQSIHQELKAAMCARLDGGTNKRAQLRISFAISIIGAELREQFLFGTSPAPLDQVSEDEFLRELVLATSAYLRL
jgi:AcrR family transcriptional regulator